MNLAELCSSTENHGSLSCSSCSVLITVHRQSRANHAHTRIRPFGDRALRAQVSRQRKEILQLQRAGIPTSSAEALLQRMLDKIDALCADRDRMKAALPKLKGKVLGGRKW
ncbi:hypothetical protein [Bradyrhizobium sp. USDA 3256]